MNFSASSAGCVLCGSMLEAQV